MKKITTLFLVFACCASLAQDSLNISLLYHWSDPNLVGSTIFDNTYNEVWGFETNDREFAVIGTTWGTHIFDITDAPNVAYVDSIPGAVQGGAIIHRDYHDYNGYLYIVADEGNSSTLQIVNISTLPDSSTVEYDSNVLFNKSHNIFIDSVHAKMYVCGGGSNQLSVYSLANPLNPTLLVDCGASVPFWNQIGYIHDIYVEDNIAYLNAGNNGLFIVDFTNTASPSLEASLTSYIHQGYNHSGWLHPNQDVYALADETHGMKIKLINTADFGNLSVIDTIGSNEDPQSIVHNLIFKDDFLYASYYYDGLYVFDVSDAQNATVAGYYHTSNLPHDNTYEGAWGVYPFYNCGKVIVSDMQEGLFVFDVTDATNEDFSVTAAYTSDVTDLDVDFIDQSTGGVDAWDWDFGDSNTSTDQNPSHTYSSYGTYQVCLTTTNGCEIETECKMVGVYPVGIKEIENTVYSVFPNPFSNQIQVMANEPIMYSLYDVAGKEVLNGTLNTGNQVIEVEKGLPKGIYSLKIEGSSTEVHKLVKVE